MPRQIGLVPLQIGQQFPDLVRSLLSSKAQGHLRSGGGEPSAYWWLVWQPLFRRLRRGTTPAEIGEFLWYELEDHFGLDPSTTGPMRWPTG
ncbi:hypothetical protein [Streptomyces sp. NPDC127112]|uniref:hypothetical protein n=1 Tax=Streptomyces sp. NPDC127112 TaxID=3345364 RepID=UPI00362F3FDE